MPAGDRAGGKGGAVRKQYASQESVERTLTTAELAAPFRAVEPDAEPLPRPTREAVIAEGETVRVVDVARVIADARGGLR